MREAKDFFILCLCQGKDLAASMPLGMLENGKVKETKLYWQHGVN